MIPNAGKLLVILIFVRKENEVIAGDILCAVIHAILFVLYTDPAVIIYGCVVCVSRHSKNQVLRYIRLTNLIPGILEKVDEGKIALTPAVELSYLTETEQANLLETMESEDCTPSLSQAIALKQTSQNGNLTMDRIFTIMTQPKANQREKISFRTDEVRKFFPKDYTAAQMQAVILKLLDEYQRKRQRDLAR